MPLLALSLPEMTLKSSFLNSTERRMLTHSDFKIRHVAEADLDILIPHLNNLTLRGEFLPCRMTSPHSIRQQFKENGLSSDDFERLLLVDHADTILGTVWHFKSVPYFNAREIGYILFSEAQRNKGLVSGAVTLLSSYLFRSSQINRLEIRMDTRNLASEKVALKCGFQKEGVARGANFVHGRHVDMCVYALLRDEAGVVP
jgi:RimJ/RimL family protein N-acetyltransferase